ncbi:MAG TPA: cellobiose phosphorylase [Lachnospiraceae bacterium]|nr:cellobiose phosphorylase [Lachnospiraceae bacterium]
MGAINFLDKDGTFSIEQPENYNNLYFPVAGDNGIKSAISPNLGGDIKINQNAFLLEPASIENLHNNRSTRNFWCIVQDRGAWSVTGASAEEECKKFTEMQDKSSLEAGFMWQTITRQSEKYQMEAKVTSFVPVKHNVEIMHVEVTNTGETEEQAVPVAAIPVFGRSADNIRDHRHVTSLLHRIRTTDYGVYVKPSLSFDERGHHKNNLTYFVCGITGKGGKPQSFYPAVEDYIGDSGTFTHPYKILKNEEGVPAGTCIEGKEAIGGIRFAQITLKPGESASYTIIMGITDNEEDIENIIMHYQTTDETKKALEEVKKYWQEKVNARYYTGNEQFDCFMRWVSFQPVLRRIYGCSFLPYHDYGRGGRGWRDLWQDCLSLLIMDPGSVRQMIIDNYGGVRLDGTNATIIGANQGEFIADRNGIARVWMDHGLWPFITTKLYIGQTGGTDILKEKACYFKDEQAERGRSLDSLWNTDYGLKQKCGDGSIYEGSILEHILLQNLCAFYETGTHNHIMLRGADWNDALDMAEENGESVAFTCAYAGNLSQLSELLMLLYEKHGWEQTELLEEMQILLKDDIELYESVSAKQELLHNYTRSCRHNISGKKIQVNLCELAENLKHKSDWIKEHIRKTEWITGSEGEGWFNSYYDNDKQPLESYSDGEAKMMLTGQVFAIMGGTASDEQIGQICKSADHYLYNKEIGGYRLNTNFKEEKFNMGRMFSFTYGEKENGAVFSHMTVMFANALYQRGFVKEGYKALQTLADTALDFKTSKIYPGIPEYFNNEGKGMYHYLTGAASWYMLTVVTEVFGVHGVTGNLVMRPKLLKEQFDAEGNASISLYFAGKKFNITYKNPQKLTYGEYIVKRAVCNSTIELVCDSSAAYLDREQIISMPDTEFQIEAELGPDSNK